MVAGPVTKGKPTSAGRQTPPPAIDAPRAPPQIGGVQRILNQGLKQLLASEFGILVAVAVAVLLAASALVMTYQAPPPPITETKDRMPPEAMATLVAPAMAAVREGDLKQAEWLFQRQIEAVRTTQGMNSLKEADLLTAFGIGVLSFGQETEDSKLQHASLPYLRRAVPAMRAAFGDVHPEVALALHSLADAEVLLAEDNPPRSADSSLVEAHRIRVATLGRHDLETVATLAALGRLKGLPGRVNGDPARLAQAAKLMGQAIADTPRGPSAGTQSEPALRAQLARIYLANGERNRGLAEIQKARAGLPALSENQRLDVTMRLSELVSEFDLPDTANATPPRR